MPASWQHRNRLPTPYTLWPEAFLGAASARNPLHVRAYRASKEHVRFISLARRVSDALARLLIITDRKPLLRPQLLFGDQALHELGPFFLIAPLSLRSHRTRWALRNGLKSRHPTPLMLVRVLATTRYDLTEVRLRRRPLRPGTGRSLF